MTTAKQWELVVETGIGATEKLLTQVISTLGDNFAQPDPQVVPYLEGQESRKVNVCTGGWLDLLRLGPDRTLVQAYTTNEPPIAKIIWELNYDLADQHLSLFDPKAYQAAPERLGAAKAAIAKRLGVLNVATVEV
jgi:hypothetical protein